MAKTYEVEVTRLRLVWRGGGEEELGRGGMLVWELYISLGRVLVEKKVEYRGSEREYPSGLWGWAAERLKSWPP